jgi:hypothetical protein
MSAAIEPSAELLAMEAAAATVDNCMHVQGATREEFGSRPDLHDVARVLCSSPDVNVARLGVHALALQRELDPDHPHIAAAYEVLDGFRDDFTAWHVAYSLSCAFGAAVNVVYGRLIDEWSDVVRLQVAVNISVNMTNDSSVAVGALIRRLLADDHPSPRRFAVDALSAESADVYPWRHEELWRAASDSNERVRAEALEALRGSGATNGDG